MNIYTDKKVVAVGGGHGLGRMLAALKTLAAMLRALLPQPTMVVQLGVFVTAKVASLGETPETASTS